MNKIFAMLLFVSILAGCAPQQHTHVAQTVQGNRFAVGLFFVDALRGHRDRASALDKFPAKKVPWETNAEIAQHLTERLTSAGNLVYILDNAQEIIQASQKSGDEDDHIKAIAQEMKNALKGQNADAFIIVTPNAVDERGRKYSAFMDIWSGGFLGLAWGAEHRDERFQPAFVFTVFDAAIYDLFGEISACRIGFNVDVVNPESFKSIAATSNAVGVMEVPKRVWAASYDAMTDANKTLLREKCLAGLKSTLDSSLDQLGLVDQI
jgi:hypothetical protein